METYFYIKKERLLELQSLIKELPSVRWEYNPIEVGDKYRIGLSLNVDDYTKLSQLQCKWYEEDNPSKEKKSFWSKLISYFN